MKRASVIALVMALVLSLAVIVYAKPVQPDLDRHTVEGREDVRALFEGFCLPFPAGLAGLEFTEIDSWTVGKTLNVQWEANACFLAEPYLGADAYETHAGLMAAQVTTFDGAELSINPDWRQDCEADLKFFTTAGPLSKDEVGNVLAHHHMFVELGDPTPDEYLLSTPEGVYEALSPWLISAKAPGLAPSSR